MTERDGQAVRAGDALPLLLAGMPPQLRLVASSPPDGEALARRDALDRAADDEAAASRLAAQAAFRDRAWEAACPKLFRGATLARLKPQQDPGRAVSGWLESGSLLLVLHGESQRGKTWAAWAVASAARDAGGWVTGGRLTELLWQLRPSDADPGRPDRVRAALATADLAVIDDLGREKATEATVAHVWDLLETRLSAGLRTVVTTNLTPTAIRAGYGDPVMWRLTETGTAVPVTGDIIRAPRVPSTT